MLFRPMLRQLARTRIEASRREQARVRAQCIVDTLDGVKARTSV